MRDNGYLDQDKTYIFLNTEEASYQKTGFGKEEMRYKILKLTWFQRTD